MVTRISAVAVVLLTVVVMGALVGETLAALPSGLYVGGAFTVLRGLTAQNIAYYNGQVWATLSTGVSGGDNFVNALLVYKNNLIAIGDFTTAGGTAALNVAQWDGASWSSLREGVDNTAWALVEYQGALVVGGDFTLAGTVSANGVAKWSGAAWSTMGTGVSGSGVYALAVYKGSLFAGGDFTAVEGVTVNRMARWNGTAWVAVGTGVTGGNVFALYVWSDLLIVAGSFTAVGGPGGAAVARVAAWNGTAYLPLDTGLDKPVWMFTQLNNELLTVGEFTITGGSAGDYAALWNGTHWRAIPVGGAGPNPLNQIVYAVTSYSNVGGSALFGGKFDGLLAVYNSSAGWQDAPGLSNSTGEVYTFAAYVAPASAAARVSSYVITASAVQRTPM